MNLPYRYRGLAMTTALLVLLPAVAWRHALSDTLRTACECRRLRTRISTVPETYSDSNDTFSDRRELILSGMILGLVPDNVSVTGCTPSITERQGTLEVHTAELTMTGTFADLLRAMHFIEREVPECAVHSAVWRITADHTARSRQLTLTLYIQQLVKTDR